MDSTATATAPRSSTPPAPAKPSPSEMLQTMIENEPLADKLVDIFYKNEEDTYLISEEGNFIGRYFEAGGTPGSLLGVLGMHIERQLHRGPEEEEGAGTAEAVPPVVNTEPEHLLALKSEPEVLEDRYKLVFYVPQNALEVVKTAVFSAGAGRYPGGKYQQCCFETIGTGQFHPVAENGANPTVGTREGEGYRVERVLEVRCEVLCISRAVLVAAVAGLRSAHPYEEPAYEAYRMEAV